MEEKEINVNHLAAKVQMAGLYREMAQSPAFADLRKYIEGKMSDLKNEWFRSSPEDSEKIKMRAQVYSEIFEVIKSRILAGDHAAMQLNELKKSQE